MDQNELANRLYNPINDICGTAASNNDYYALWSCYSTGAFFNFLISTIVFSLLAEPGLKLFFGGYFEHVKINRPHHAISLRLQVGVLINATLTFSLVFFEAYILHVIARKGLAGAPGFELPARPSLWLASGSLVGYMLHHLLVMFYHRTLVERSMGSTMFQTILVHHVCSILLFPVSLRVGLGCYFVAMFVQSEVTSIPLAFRTFGVRMGKPFTTSVWFQLANVTWLLAWVFFRLTPMPSMLKTLAQSDWSKFDGITYTLCWFIYIPFIINLWWTRGMVMSAYKHFCRRKNKQS